VQLATIRKRGYATSNEESESGVSSVAFPFHSTPARIAFNVALPTSRMSAADQRCVGDALRRTVAEAAELLHG
jgi:DNA-binding IclR family transcriptional regulator